MTLAIFAEWILAKRLGPAEFGLFKTAALAIPVFVMQVVNLNMEPGILHFSVNRPGDAARLGTTALSYALVAGALVGGMGAVTATAWGPLVTAGVPAALWAICLAQVPFLVAQPYLRACLLARGRYVAYNAILPSERLLGLLGILACGLVAGWTSERIAWGWLAGSAGSVAVGTLLLTSGGGLAGRPSWRSLGELLRFGLGFAFAQICVLALFSVNQVLVLRTCGKTEAGAYAMAAMMGQILLYLPQAMAPAYYRRLSGLAPAASLAMARQAARLVCLFLALLALGMGVLAPWALRQILPDYAGSAHVFAWLLPGVVAMGGELFLVYYLRIRERNGLLHLATCLALAADLLLCWLWLPRDGAVGAARAFSVSAWLMLGIMAAACRIPPREAS